MEAVGQLQKERELQEDKSGRSAFGVVEEVEVEVVVLGVVVVSVVVEEVVVEEGV